MTELEFTPDEMAQMVDRIKAHFARELDQEIGSFDAEFLIRFFAEEIGGYFYNRGLYDAQALFARKVDEFADAVYELERPTAFTR